jgi:hypothetical protein
MTPPGDSGFTISDPPSEAQPQTIARKRTRFSVNKEPAV